jgi:macrolide phosphotransferase
MRAAAGIVDRAVATGLVPAALVQRWSDAIEDAPLWQFTPVVINGSLGSDSFLTADSAVTGVLGWHGLRVGDPARDLRWLLGRGDDDISGLAFDVYSRARGSVDRRLKQRATLLSELEVARWLLHGTQVRSTEIVDDAVEMMSKLVDDAQTDMANAIGPQTMPVLGVDEVEALLERAERTAS